MKKNLLLMVCTMILASCIDHEDLYDPNNVKDNAKTNFPLENIDPTQDWATRGTRTLDVIVNEKDGQNYTIKVFTANPLAVDTDARLLAQTEVKDGVASSLKFDASLDLEYVYVMCKAGEKDYSVSAVPLVDNKFAVSFGKQVVTRAGYELPGGIELDDDMYDPTGANDVQEGSNIDGIVSMYGKYKIAQGQTFEGTNLTFMGAHLYISGTLNAKTLRLSSGSAISVLEGGQLIVEQLLLQGGTFYNAGTVVTGSTMVTGSKCLNAGTYTVNGLLLNPNSIIQNDCKLFVDDLKLLGGNFNNGGYVKSKSVAMLNNVSLNLSGSSVFDVENEANINVSTITGPTVKPYPLFTAKTLVKNGTIARNGHVNTNEKADKAFAEKLNFEVIKATIGALPEGGCVPPINIEGDGTENLPVSGCTIGFEDISAKTVTDYDFNDVVIWVSNPVNKVSSIYLVAVGATNSIKVGYALDNKNYYLFEGKEVHELLGVSTGTMFNTSGKVVTENLPMEMLQVAGPVLENLNFFIEVNGKTDNLIYSKNDKEYIGGIPFGLCVNENWSFPTERTKISDAYKGFGEWGANKKTNPTWYKAGESGLVCPFDSKLLKK